MNEDISGLGAESAFQFPYRVTAGSWKANADAVRTSCYFVYPGNANGGANLFVSEVEDIGQHFKGGCSFKQIKGYHFAGHIARSGCLSSAAQAQTQGGGLKGGLKGVSLLKSGLHCLKSSGACSVDVTIIASPNSISNSLKLVSKSVYGMGLNGITSQSPIRTQLPAGKD